MPRSWLPLLVALGCAGSPARQGAPPARRLTIVGINDAHGALLPTPPPKWAAAGTRNEIGGADWFAGYLDAIRADSREKGGGVLLLDAGDAFQGTMIVAYVKEHRPLTAEVLGAASSGKEPRWTQIGSARRRQAGE
jgi:2',3'-cyclic-nucleotide 2'-phosphodiesterase (5'-nucleotidase family)